MYLQRLLTLAGAAAALTACASSRQAADRADASVAAAAATTQSMRWTATLEPQSGSTVTGSGTVAPGSTADQTSASVTLANAESGAVHPWHIHSGRCGDNGPIVGPASAYPPLNVGADGSSTASATLPLATPVSGSYYINVHRSPTEMGTIVACGNLSMGAR
jgi:hypothetical protein